MVPPAGVLVTLHLSILGSDETEACDLRLDRLLVQVAGRRRSGLTRGFALCFQANVEHLTQKMKTSIQRGLVLR